jgi:hypothetical protein
MNKDISIIITYTEGKYTGFLKPILDRDIKRKIG